MKSLKYLINKLFGYVCDKPIIPEGKTVGYSLVRSEKAHAEYGRYTKVYPPFFIHYVKVGDYSYIAKNSHISNCEIGKFCSIGPNFSCGMGSHPLNGISTSPMFYSTAKQNGLSLCEKNTFHEQKLTTIDNDVFIGANVTVLDGVHISDGAVIGAGAVVTKDIPPYAIAVGVPAKVIKYRFDNEIIKGLLERRWWDDPDERLQVIEESFWNVEEFLRNNN